MPSKILTMSEFKTRAYDAFSMIRICRMHSNESADYINEHIYTELNRKHGGKKRVYNSFMSGYVAGLIDACRDDIWRNHVEFCYLVDGELYSTHKNSTRKTTEKFYTAGKGNILADSPSGHIWIGSDKIYTGFEKE